MDPQRHASVCSCVTMQGKIIFMKTAAKSPGNVEDFTFLGETVNKQNHIHREAKNRLKSVNSYHCAYKNPLSSYLVPKKNN